MQQQCVHVFDVARAPSLAASMEDGQLCLRTFLQLSANQPDGSQRGLLKKEVKLHYVQQCDPSAVFV